MRKYQIVCIDDDEQFLNSLANVLPDKVAPLCKDFECCFEFVASADELFEVLSQSDATSKLAMLISDQVLPGTTGLNLIEKVKADHPDIVCMLLTGHAGLDSARYAINKRLLDQYVSKPIDDIHVFVSLVANLLRRYHINLEERERTDHLAETIVQLRTSNEEIGAMQTAAEQMAMLSKSCKSLDLDEVVAVASHEVPKIFKAQRAILYFGSNGCPVELTGRQRCPCPQAQLLSRTDVRATLQGSQVSYGPVPDVCASLGGQSPEVVVPLSISAFPASDGGPREWHGYLCMCSMDPATAGYVDLMKYKAGLASEILSASLTNAALYQQAKRDSQTDHLTGAGTRRVLEVELEAEHERAVRYGHPFCVVIVDVDRFKNINDKSGHPAGDQVLRRLVEILGREKRATDVLARYGGDEFAILMPETSLQGAVDVAERMRKKVESSLAVQDQPVTISCGLAGWSSPQDEAPTDVLRRADAALYQAKQAGRNRVQTMKAA